MRIIRLFGLLFACVLLVSCQQDISGTYKAIKSSDQLEKELIIIDWDGDRYFERAMIGHANELYTDESQRPNRHARIEYDYRAYVKGKLERQGKKYIAKELKAGIEIDEDQLTINKYFYEPLPKVTKEELIKYIQADEEFELYKEMVVICEDGIKNFRDDLEDDGTRGFIPLELDHYAAPMDNLSRIYMKRGEHDKALHLLEQVMPMYRILEIFEKKYTYQRCYALKAMAECLDKLGRDNMAILCKYELKHLQQEVLESRENAGSCFK